jgi:16S rRNA (guanine1516-N2)-methyltransferase
LFISTSFHPGVKEMQEARSLALFLDVPYVERGGSSLSHLFQRAHKDEVILVSKQGWRYEDRSGNHFSFHPNLSILRIKQLMKGGADALVSCAGMQSGDEVLDCTLGMGADAIVSSFVVGKRGKVVALESQPVIAAIVQQGLQTYQTNYEPLCQAMRTIEVIQVDYRSYLKRCPARSFDIVLFDPMFCETVTPSTAMQALKQIANPKRVDAASVKEAVRVARKAVLLKERSQSGEFERLGFQRMKRSSRSAWGVIWQKHKTDDIDNYSCRELFSPLCRNPSSDTE